MTFPAHPALQLGFASSILHFGAYTPVGWACSCPGYEHTGVCKHLGAVQRRAAREGWPFARIAPLDTVERYMPLDPDPEPDPEPTPPAGGAALDPAAIAAARARGRAAVADLFDDAA